MRIDPEMADLPRFTTSSGDPKAERAAVEVYYAEIAAAVPIPDGMRVTDVEVHREGGLPPMAVRLYQPRGRAAGALLYPHGGGFTVGNLDAEHRRCIEMADAVGCVVISPDYRLAPEDPFPAGVEDCFTALLWAAAQHDSLDFPIERIAVGGCSAGGGLAAATALLARDRGGPAIFFQMLVYPVLDDRMDSYSARTFIDVPIFQRDQMAQMWDHYHPNRANEISPYATPLRAESLAELPPAFILAAGLDPLRDEAIHYALRLQEHDIPVELHVLPYLPHGFDAVAPDTRAGRRAVKDIAAALRDAFIATW